MVMNLSTTSAALAVGLVHATLSAAQPNIFQQGSGTITLGFPTFGVFTTLFAPLYSCFCSLLI